MGLIRSGNTNLTPFSSDDSLTNYLWPIAAEMIKTAIENDQNLTIEGCYIPYNFADYFSQEYLKNIKHYWLVLSENYIKNNFDKIQKFASIVEKRLDDSDCTIESVLKDNQDILALVKKHNLNYIFIENDYEQSILKGILK